jgi:hypothetical protein
MLGAGKARQTQLRLNAIHKVALHVVEGNADGISNSHHALKIRGDTGGIHYHPITGDSLQSHTSASKRLVISSSQTFRDTH